MGIKTKQILAVLIGVLPLYIINIYANVTDNIAYLPEVVLLKYPAFVALVLLIVFLLNKFLLKKELSVFNQYKSTFLYDIAIAFLFLITYYFLLSLSQISYTRWLNENVDQTAVFDLARNIYANWFYTSLLFIIISSPPYLNAEDLFLIFLFSYSPSVFFSHLHLWNFLPEVYLSIYF